MSAKHTPGPWAVVPQAALMDQDGTILLGCNHHEIRPAAGQKLGDEMADLVLAAAAPEMLEALARLLQMCDWLRLPGQPKSDSMKNAEAVIAKATMSAPTVQHLPSEDTEGGAI